jgi:hypothetical protein
MNTVVDFFDQLSLGVEAIVGRVPGFVLVQECRASDEEGPSVQWNEMVKAKHILRSCVCRRITGASWATVCCNVAGDSDYKKRKFKQLQSY